ncbi:TIR domain-containing protein [Arthrobacter sp. H16F315]|nr:TIR domain-containing protein [Arthrobacter sp. H16F315]MDD1475476.1 TIR domain-containing protein [Arthrobacter sp. H16F315]
MRGNVYGQARISIFRRRGSAVRRTVQGQAQNQKSDMAFDDYSVKTAYNSVNAEYIKSQITPKIRAASATVVLIGATTSSSSWVQWEVEKSVALGNKVIGVSLSTAGSTPASLIESGAKIVAWDVAKIVSELA